MNSDSLVALARLIRRKADLKAETDEVQDQINDLEKRVLAEFVDTGISSVKVGVDGAQRTLYVHRNVYAKIEASDLLIPALKAAGHGSLVKETVNSNSLSALVREWESDGGIPHTFNGILSTSEVYQVRMRG